MRIRIESDGTSSRTTVYALEADGTRRELDTVTAVTWVVRAGGEARALVEFAGVEVDAEADVTPPAPDRGVRMYPITYVAGVGAVTAGTGEVLIETRPTTGGGGGGGGSAAVVSLPVTPTEPGAPGNQRGGR